MKGSIVVELAPTPQEEPAVITRINQFEAREDCEDKLFEFLQSVISVIEKCPGCKSCQLLRSTDSPAQFAIIEVWDSIEDHQSAAKAIPPEKIAQAMALFAKPPSGAYYRA
jgi:quinol monooxygenase YgiN